MDMTEKEIIESGVESARKLAESLKNESISTMESMINEYRKQIEIMRIFATSSTPGSEIRRYFEETIRWFSELIFDLEWSKKGLVGAKNSALKYVERVEGMKENGQE